MPRNIEIKARISSIDDVLARVRSIADQGPWEIRQDDTYFACSAGRLKLRTGSEAGELIYYCRANQAGPKESVYQRLPAPDPYALRELLDQALGQVGRVQKVRTLFLHGRTRIHLDRVAGLGDFLELEVVLGDHEAPAQGIAEAHELLTRLGIGGAQLLEGSYLELPVSASGT